MKTGILDILCLIIYINNKNKRESRTRLNKKNQKKILRKIIFYYKNRNSDTSYGTIEIYSYSVFVFILISTS